MNKKWLILIILFIAILVFWQTGGINYILARTVFSPNFSPDSDGEDLEENIETEKENEKKDKEFKEKDEYGDEILFSTKELDYKFEIIGEGFEIPWEILPIDSERFLITERAGRVILLNDGEIYNVHDVEHIGEGGLLGIEKSPNFEENRKVFIYYTYSLENQIFNKVSRFTLVENTLIEEKIVLDKIPGARFHNGGRIKFGPDEKLYITTGDAQNSNLSQDLNSMAGKILRINEDGTIPDDNPYEDSPVYAYGLRNPQGISWHPVTGQLFASDHGPNSQDEVNKILPGSNYGWPEVTCSDGETKYQDPITCYDDFTLAPSGITFLPSENLIETPLYVAGLRGNMVMRIDLDGEGNFIRQDELFREYGRIRTIVYYEGSLYAATNNRDGRGVPKENDDIILKITPVFP